VLNLPLFGHLGRRFEKRGTKTIQNLPLFRKTGSPARESAGEDKEESPRWEWEVWARRSKVSQSRGKLQSDKLALFCEGEEWVLQKGEDGEGGARAWIGVQVKGVWDFRFIRRGGLKQIIQPPPPTNKNFGKKNRILYFSPPFPSFSDRR